MIILCSIGRPKHQKVMAGALQGDHFIGKQAEELRGLLSLKYPMSRGIVDDWNDMERVFYHIFENELGVQKEDHPVLITENALNPRKNREQLAQFFFETCNVPSFFVSIQAVLSL